ncbi:MAG: hypothetical protein AAGF60_09500 [Pseudomonadota bacterium]
MSPLPRMLRFVFIGTILPVVLVGLYALTALGVAAAGDCRIGTSCIVSGWEAGHFIARLNVLEDMFLFAGIWAGVGIALLTGLFVLMVKSRGQT